MEFSLFSYIYENIVHATFYKLENSTSFSISVLLYTCMHVQPTLSHYSSNFHRLVIKLFQDLRVDNYETKFVQWQEQSNNNFCIVSHYIIIAIEKQIVRKMWKLFGFFFFLLEHNFLLLFAWKSTNLELRW